MIRNNITPTVVKKKKNSMMITPTVTITELSQDISHLFPSVVESVFLNNTTIVSTISTGRNRVRAPPMLQ